MFLEPADFNPKHIDLTGQALNLLNERRAKLERAVDPENAKATLDDAAQMRCGYAQHT